MVIGLIAAALVLIAFNIWAALAYDRAQLALMSRVMAWLTLVAAFALPLAILATFLAPSATAPLNLRLYHLSAGRQLSDAIPLEDRMLAFACAAPFLSGFQNVIGIVIIAIGVYEAWKLNKRVPLVISGPHAIAPVAVAAPAFV